MIKKLLIIVVFFLGAITSAQSETSWIKKKDKSEKVEKVKKESSSWIKKKILNLLMNGLGGSVAKNR